MSVTWKQKPTGGSIQFGEQEGRSFNLEGFGATTDTLETAKADLVSSGYGAATATIGGVSMFLRTATVDEAVQKGRFTARTTFTSYPKVRFEVGQTHLAFEFGGGTKHITHSLSTINVYPAAGVTAPDFGGAINVTRDGQILGCDVPGPAERHFDITDYILTNTVTDSWMNALGAYAYSVNSDTFRGLAAGEVLCYGIRGCPRDAFVFELSRRFAVSKNVTGKTVGGISGVACDGWDFMWTLTKRKPAGNFIVPEARAIYIERVCPRLAFSGMVVR